MNWLHHIGELNNIQLFFQEFYTRFTVIHNCFSTDYIVIIYMLIGLYKRKVNPSFYRISAEEDVFNRYYHKPLPGESVETYSATEIYHWLKQKSPESMRNISVQRLAQTLSAIGIERIHTYYGNLYRVVSLPSQ